MKPKIDDNYAQKGMRYPALNDLVAKADNKYELVLATAKRAREIIDHSEPLVKITIDNPISIATAEIADGLITLENPVFEKDKNSEEEIAGPTAKVEINTEEFAQSTDENI